MNIRKKIVDAMEIEENDFIEMKKTIWNKEILNQYKNYFNDIINFLNNKNYKKLLLNKVNFLAISGYIFNNKKYKPVEAIKKLI